MGNWKTLLFRDSFFYFTNNVYREPVVLFISVISLLFENRETYYLWNIENNIFQLITEVPSNFPFATPLHPFVEHRPSKRSLAIFIVETLFQFHYKLLFLKSLQCCL